MSEQDQKIQLAAALTTSAAFLQTMYLFYAHRRPNEPNINRSILTDPAFKEQKSLGRQEAFKRSSVISNLSYQLSLALLSGGDTYHGVVTINFDLSYLGH